MSEIWFTSDTHYAHSNICGQSISTWNKGWRNFPSLNEMNDAIVGSINNLVLPQDTLYHLGDWSFGGKDKVQEFRDGLNCQNIVLIFGNHDHHIRKSFGHLFSETHSLLHKTFRKKLFVMCHFSMRVWEKSHHGSFHLYGHSHHSIPDYGKSMDIGWCKFRRPLHLNEIFDTLNQRNIEFPDHHGPDTSP